MPEHPPTPWTEWDGDRFRDANARTVVWPSYNETIEWADGAREFLLRAVNSHEALVEALRELARAFVSDPGCCAHCARSTWGYQRAKEALELAGADPLD